MDYLQKKIIEVVEINEFLPRKIEEEKIAYFIKEDIV